MRAFAQRAAQSGWLALLAFVLVGCALQPESPQPAAIQLEPSLIGRLAPVHPDEPVEFTYNERFSLENALARVQQIRAVPTAVGEARMAMHNWTGAIEGTLLKQEYLILQAQFELAKYQLRDADITPSEYAAREAAFREAEAAFLAFWDGFGISD